MANVNALLGERLKKKDKPTKMTALAKRSSEGGLTSFAGVFSLSELTLEEKATLENILTQHNFNKKEMKEDLEALIRITSEVKAINNQAALLHGERIKKAQEILKNYKEGAFTEWLKASYGNRQTPYNFLQYFIFYQTLPSNLKELVDLMPRQAIYTLASREGAPAIKQQFVESYQGESKDELLQRIRESFPLNDSDKRKQNLTDSAINHLRKALLYLGKSNCKVSKKQKSSLLQLLEEFYDLVHE